MKIYSSLQELIAITEAMVAAPDKISVLMRLPAGTDNPRLLQSMNLLLSARPNYEREPENNIPRVSVSYKFKRLKV